MRLSREFFLRPTPTVAPDLLGKVIVRKTDNGYTRAIISEVEAYLGPEDLASHAAAKKTTRAQVMWQHGGYAYVYFIYGMHFCFNVVTDAEGVPGAVLVRGVVPFDASDMSDEVSGPGRVSTFLHIQKSENGIDCVTSDTLFFEDHHIAVTGIEHTPRIGITKATDKLWRFRITGFQPGSEKP